MGRLRVRIGQLMRRAERHALVIPQADGSVVRLPPDTFLQAFSVEARRVRETHQPGYTTLGAHPLTVAAQNTPDEKVKAELGALLMLTSYAEGEGNES